jgi:transitional endoplasmic reticulum ATPase
VDILSNKNNESNENVVSLRVAEAEQSDVGRKIARIDPDVAQQLKISAGDALELSSLGKKTTVLHWPAKERDRGKGLGRIDGNLRNRLDVQKYCRTVWQTQYREIRTIKVNR